jgi:hypothetical protein
VTETPEPDERDEEVEDLAVPADEADKVVGGVTGPCDRPRK